MQTKLFRKVPKLQNINKNIDFKWSKTSKNVEKQNWMKISPNVPRTSNSIDTQEGLCAQPVFKKEAKNKRKPFEARNKKEKEISDLPSFMENEALKVIPKSLHKKLSKKKKKNTGLQGNSEELLNVEQESCAQSISEEGLSQEKQKKKSKKVDFTGLNTHGSDFGGKRDVASPLILAKYKDHPADDTRKNKSKKRKHTLPESCNSSFQDDLLNDDLHSKRLKLDDTHSYKVLKHCKKKHKDLGRPEVLLETKGILKHKKEFLLQSEEQNIQENTVHRKKNKNTKLLIHKNTVMSQPSMKRDEETGNQSEKRRQTEHSHSEHTDVFSDTEESHVKEADEKCFRLDYEGKKSLKQKKKKRKNSGNSFDDIMQDSTSEVNAITTSKKSDNSMQISENISILGNEDLSENNEQIAQKEQLKNDSANYIKLPKKKMRGFDGREDNSERLGRTVFVGNLPLLVDKKVLQMLFRSFGKIESVRLRSVVPAKSSISKKVAMIKKEFHSESNSVNAYVVFKNAEDAKSSQALNKTVFQGHHIRVDLFRDSQTYDNKHSVFVGNLPYNVTDEKMWEVFGECGNIEAVRIVRDPTTGIGKGFGFVLFEKKKSVKSALELNDTEVNGRNIRVKVSEDKGSKQKENEPQKNKRMGLKLEKKIKKPGFRLSGQKKTKKKLIKKQRGIQKKKHIASILSHK